MAPASAGSSTRNPSACSAKYRQALAHFCTSWRAAATVLPISVVIISATVSTSESKRSAAASIQAERWAKVELR